MPKGPHGQKRPGDVIGAAIMVAKIATGEIAESASKDAGKSASGAKGGRVRAQKLGTDARFTAAKAAANARWDQK